MAITYTHLEDFIFNLYQKINIIKPEELDIISISNRLNIDVLYMPIQSVCIENIIILDVRMSIRKQRQIFFHELSHYLLHSGNQLKLTKDFVEYQEHKANQFMYHAAIPTFMLDNLKSNFFTANKIAALFCVELDFAQQRLDHYIAQRYQASILKRNTINIANKL